MNTASFIALVCLLLGVPALAGLVFTWAAYPELRPTKRGRAARQLEALRCWSWDTPHYDKAKGFYAARDYRAVDRLYNDAALLALESDDD